MLLCNIMHSEEAGKTIKTAKNAITVRTFRMSGKNRINAPENTKKMPNH